MKKLWLIGLLFLAIFTEVKAQNLNCQEQLVCRVTASNGLRMRTDPSMKGNLVTTVPRDSIIVACGNTAGSLTVEGLEGYWRKAKYKENTGYMYDGFLEIKKIIKNNPKPTSPQKTKNEKLHFRVTASSGLRMRGRPGTQGQTITTVPTDSLVSASQETYGSLTINGEKGYWRKVAYKQHTGYMYDGFLQKVKVETGIPDRSSTETPSDSFSTKVGSENKRLNEAKMPDEKSSTPEPGSAAPLSYDLLTEVYNYCGDVTKIDPGRVWYGVYLPEEQGKPLEIKLVNVEVVLSKHRNQENMEFDIRTNQDKSSLFLIGTTNATQWDKLQLANPLPRLKNDQGKIFPGQEKQLTTDKQRLRAGGGYSASDTCADLSNYKLFSIAGSGQQNITPLLLENNPCTIPKLYWYGDLTQDGIPELIFATEKNKQYHFSLLVSNAQNPGNHYQKVSDWKIINCP